MDLNIIVDELQLFRQTDELLHSYICVDCTESFSLSNYDLVYRLCLTCSAKLLSDFSETTEKSLNSFSAAVTLEDSNVDFLNRTALVLPASNDNQGVAEIAILETDDLYLIARMQHCTQTKPNQMSFVMNNATVDFNLCSDPMAPGKKYYLFSSPNNCLPFLLYWWLTYEGYFSSKHALIAPCILNKRAGCANDDEFVGDNIILVKIMRTRCSKPRMDGILKNCSMAEPNMWVEEDILRYVNTKKVFCNKNVPFDNAEWYVYQHPHKYLSSYKFVVPAIC